MNFSFTVQDLPPDMTSVMKENLVKCRVTLLRDLIIDPMLLSVLLINNTITDDMKQTIQVIIMSPCF